MRQSYYASFAEDSGTQNASRHSFTALQIRINGTTPQIELLNQNPNLYEGASDAGQYNGHSDVCWSNMLCSGTNLPVVREMIHVEKLDIGPHVVRRKAHWIQRWYMHLSFVQFRTHEEHHTHELKRAGN